MVKKSLENSLGSQKPTSGAIKRTICVGPINYGTVATGCKIVSENPGFTVGLRKKSVFVNILT
jgi:hypothetical protein